MGEGSAPVEERATVATVAIEQFLRLEAGVLRALAHPARLQILQLLRERERCVCEFESLLGLRQPNISQHLAILRAAGLVTTRRDGLRVLYSVADPALYALLDGVAGIVRRQSAGVAAAVARAAEP